MFGRIAALAINDLIITHYSFFVTCANAECIFNLLNCNDSVFASDVNKTLHGTGLGPEAPDLEYCKDWLKLCSFEWPAMPESWSIPL